MEKIFCSRCNKAYDKELMELEDGYYYCHVCGNPIDKKEDIEIVYDEDFENEE
jgi:late competence protein required for DNA uptake (superfamily II DNA/RNA helicase)